MGIAENLKRLRLEAGLSQPELAKRAGVSQQLISQIERGTNRTTKELPRLARALGKPVQEIDPTYDAVVVTVDAARDELLEIYDRLGALPNWRQYLLDQARQLESLAQRSAAPQEPTPEGGQ